MTRTWYIHIHWLYPSEKMPSKKGSTSSTSSYRGELTGMSCNSHVYNLQWLTSSLWKAAQAPVLYPNSLHGGPHNLGYQSHLNSSVFTYFQRQVIKHCIFCTHAHFAKKKPVASSCNLGDLPWSSALEVQKIDENCIKLHLFSEYGWVSPSKSISCKIMIILSTLAGTRLKGKQNLSLSPSCTLLHSYERFEAFGSRSLVHTSGWTVRNLLKIDRKKTTQMVQKNLQLWDWL